MRALVKEISVLLREKQMMLATAESCTGGMLAMAVTDEPGASFIFERGFVTYSNDSKAETLDVSREILENYGAVSRECAAAMVHGIFAHSHANLALSITGIAGPNGATAEKPIGLVYIGCGLRGREATVNEYFFQGSRAHIRKESAENALKLALSCLKGA